VALILRKETKEYIRVLRQKVKEKETS